MTRLHESLQNRDARAWDEVYEEHVRELYGFVFRLVRGDPQTAADAFQDTWLDAISHIGQFDPQRGELRSWLFGIARRRIALHWRQRLARSGTAAACEQISPRSWAGRRAGRRYRASRTSGRRASRLLACRPSGGRYWSTSMSRSFPSPRSRAGPASRPKRWSRSFPVHGNKSERRSAWVLLGREMQERTMKTTSRMLTIPIAITRPSAVCSAGRSAGDRAAPRLARSRAGQAAREDRAVDRPAIPAGDGPMGQEGLVCSGRPRRRSC